MINALVVGVASGLGECISLELLKRGVVVHGISRSPLNPGFIKSFQGKTGNFSHLRLSDYNQYVPVMTFDSVFFSTGSFFLNSLSQMTQKNIEADIQTNLTVPILITRKILLFDPPQSRCLDFVYIGSTSAHSGFADSSVYCATKFGLRGFVQSMNAEYTHSNKRFWLASMGTMNTPTGQRVAINSGRNLETLLDPSDVARIIITSVIEGNKYFEPEIMIRTRPGRI